MKQFGRGIIIFLIATVFNYVKASENNLFSTWEGLEADKCASIWLIKRFISPKAQIRFYPKGDIIVEGIAFDTPEAEFRRYHSKSTFETLQQHYEVLDQTAIYMGRIIHDIEINTWGKKMLPETRQVINDVQPILVKKSSEDAVTECSIYFEKLYKQLARL
jgi:hypothetical protein